MLVPILVPVLILVVPTSVHYILGFEQMMQVQLADGVPLLKSSLRRPHLTPTPPLFQLGPIRLPYTWIWSNDSVFLELAATAYLRIST